VYIHTLLLAAALIADAIGEDELRKTASEQLAPYFSPWLDGTNADALLYDTEWGAVSHIYYYCCLYNCIVYYFVILQCIAMCTCWYRDQKLRIVLVVEVALEVTCTVQR
jgi:hypothetical protein